MSKKPTASPSCYHKPPEVFAGIIPPDRRLYAGDIYLQRLRKSQADELLQLYLANRDFLERWLQPLPSNMNKLQMQKLIADDHRLARSGSRLDLGLFMTDTGRLIGRIALHSVDYGIQLSAGISYWISQEHSRAGFMTRALATLTSFAFEEIYLHRLWLHIICDNVASLQLAHKLGFVHEGRLRENLFVAGKWQDSLVLSLLAAEYDEKADGWIENGWLGGVSS